MDRAVVAQMVHRYLVEEGHKFAAMAFLDSAPKADQGEHAHGALLALLDRAEEMQRVAEASCTTAETAKADEEARILERPGDGVYCDAQVAKLEGTHNLSIVATTLVSMPPSLSAAAAKDDNKTKQLELLTASADRTLRLTPLSGLPLFAIPDEGRVVAHAAAPVLCFDMRPTGVDSKEGGPLVVAYGDMGGHVALVDLISGTTLSTRRDHRKYCVRMAWSDDGTLLATAGYDSTVCLYAVRDKGTSKETEEATAAAVTADGEGGEGEGGGGEGGGESEGGGRKGGGNGREQEQEQEQAQHGKDFTLAATSSKATAITLELLYQFPMRGAVECLTFSPPLPHNCGGDGDGKEEGDSTTTTASSSSSSLTSSCSTTTAAPVVVVGTRDDHRLHLLDTASYERTYLNMNAMGDNFVSFTPMDVSLSPNGLFYLVSTDKDRLILLSRTTGRIAASLYGARSDSFASPRHAWHPTGHYIYATTAAHSIVVFDVARRTQVAELTGHTAQVRSLAYNACSGLLVTGGFDKMVHVWAPQALLDAADAQEKEEKLRG